MLELNPLDWKTRVGWDRILALPDRVRALSYVQTILRRWMRLSPSTRALPLHLWRAIKNFADNDTRQAAALSYYAVFSMFPLILLMAVGIGAILEPAVAQEQISQALLLFLPEESETIGLFQDSLSQALDQGGSFGVVALIGLIWSALGLFANLTASLDRIFQAPSSRSLWRKRALAFLMTIALIALVGTSFITSGILRLFNALFVYTPNLWISIGTFFLPLGLNLVIFLLVMGYVPSRRVNWEAIWPASIFGALAFELAKSLFAWYLGNVANFQVVYGSIATVIVLLLWAYLVACIFLISAELCSQLDLWMMRKQEAPHISIYSEAAAQLPAEIPPPM